MLIVDDQALVRAGFHAILESQPDLEVVGESDDGVGAIERARALTPDIVLMDIRMPRLDGIEATRRLCADPDWLGRIIVLTTYDADENVWDALHAGASGFVLKTTTAAELVHAVRTVAAGKELLAPEVTKRLVREFVSHPRPGTQPQPMAELTERGSRGPAPGRRGTFQLRHRARDVRRRIDREDPHQPAVRQARRARPRPGRRTRV